MGVALADLQYAVLAVASGVIAAELGVAWSVGVALAGLVGMRLVSSWMLRRRDALSPEDEAILETVELAILDRPSLSSTSH